MQSCDPFSPLGVDPGLAKAILEFKNTTLELVQTVQKEIKNVRTGKNVSELQKKSESARQKVDAELNRIQIEVGGIIRK